MVLFNQLFLSYSKSYTLYLRLFVLMVVTWIMELIAVISSDDIVLMERDICICAHGIIIFGLFVLRPPVLRLVKKRYFRS